MSVAKCRCPHITQFYSPFAATVHKEIAMNGMKLGRSNNFSQLFHVHWFDINNICQQVD